MRVAVMELCAGGPIMKMSQGERVDPMGEDEARSVFKQLVLGLAYLHHNQIVHRDIKPESEPSTPSTSPHPVLSLSLSLEPAY